MSKIPYILHQTYINDSDPKFKTNKESWVKCDWLERKFYNDEDINNYVKNNMPKLLPFFMSMKRKIEKIDFFRYVVLFNEGGIYADMDTTLLESNNKKNIK